MALLVDLFSSMNLMTITSSEHVILLVPLLVVTTACCTAVPWLRLPRTLETAMQKSWGSKEFLCRHVWRNVASNVSTSEDL